MAIKKQSGFYNLSQYEANCQNNKYLQALVLAYYCSTRDVCLLEGIKQIEESNDWEVYYDEYKRYYSGDDIEVISEKQDLFDPLLMDGISKESTATA